MEVKNAALAKRELTHALAYDTSEFRFFKDFIGPGLHLCHLEHIIGVIR